MNNNKLGKEPKDMKFRKAQEQKSKILGAVPKKVPQKLISSTMKKKAQEEIVGFSMIIVIVAVILVIFLSFAIKSPQKDTIESYEVESYLQSLLQKTSNCKSTDNLRYYSVKELMFRCYLNEVCLDGKIICDVFVKELGMVSNQSWDIRAGSSIRGYSINATVNGVKFRTLSYGNKTRSSKGASQELTRGGNMFNLEFKAYY